MHENLENLLLKAVVSAFVAHRMDCNKCYH